MDTKLLKLISGQEIIGRVVAEDDTSVTLENIRAIKVVQLAPDSYGLDIVPFSPTLPDAAWKYNKSVVLADVSSLPEQLVMAYNQKVSGIEIVSSLSDQLLQK